MAYCSQFKKKTITIMDNLDSLNWLKYTTLRSDFGQFVPQLVALHIIIFRAGTNIIRYSVNIPTCKANGIAKNDDLKPDHTVKQLQNSFNNFR